MVVGAIRALAWYEQSFNFYIQAGDFLVDGMGKSKFVRKIRFLIFQVFNFSDEH